MPYLELPNHRIYYQLEGSGLQIVMVHAGVADSRMWDRQAAAWRDYYQMVRYDLPGFGKSSLPDAPYTNHEDLKALVDHIGLEHFWLVGASFGGLIALDFTLTYPEHVTGLVLAVPGVSGLQSSAEQMAFADEEDVLLDDGRLEEASWLNVQRWVDGPDRGPDVVDSAVRQLVYEMQLASFEIPEPENAEVRPLDPPAIGRLDEIVVPVLVFAGALDVLGMLGRADTVASGIPQATQIVVPDAAHLINLEKPGWFNEKVQAFIAANS